MKFLIGFLTCDSTQILNRFWDSLICTLRPEDTYDMFWVDNCSRDNTEEVQRKYINNSPVNLVGFVKKNTNTGIVEPRNDILKFAMTNGSYDYILFLNDDLYFNNGWVDATLNAFSWHPKNGLVTIQDNTGAIPTPKGRAVSSCGGVYWALNPKMVMEIGIINPKFRWLSQDIEYCYRVYDFGWRVVVVDPGNIIEHKHYSRRRAYQDFAEFARVDNWRAALMMHFVNDWYLWRLRDDYIKSGVHLTSKLTDDRTSPIWGRGNTDFSKIDEIDYEGM
jgi:GT2 family glycosyltransferase